jgi:hypothetical protein
VDDYVFGHAMRAHHHAGLGSEGDSKERLDAIVAYLTEQLADGAYPHLEAIAGDDPAAGFAQIGHIRSDDDRFERGLRRLLDGLEAWVEEDRP